MCVSWAHGGLDFFTACLTKICDSIWFWMRNKISFRVLKEATDIWKWDDSQYINKILKIDSWWWSLYTCFKYCPDISWWDGGQSEIDGQPASAHFPSKSSSSCSCSCNVVRPQSSVLNILPLPSFSFISSLHDFIHSLGLGYHIPFLGLQPRAPTWVPDLHVSLDVSHSP